MALACAHARAGHAPTARAPRSAPLRAPSASPRCPAARAAPLFPTGGSGGPSPSSSPLEERAAISVAVAEPPPVQPPPAPLAVVHSAAFVRSRQRQPSASAAPLAAPPAALPPARTEPQAGNAIVWALRKVDAQLDRIEADPPALLQASYKVANSPVGAVTGRGVQAAARLTMAATSQAVKAAAPIGGWALKEGFKAASKAAVGLVTLAIEQRQAQEEEGRRGKQQGQQQKKDGGQR
ncbi:hypothetical protein Rsub_03356 [Raphidocelis subcapitata]|uniref:Senescence domain-containing protein n=1 Tax=Raphidocelis subcapitata TaxID=307507 RepID=A0A2V0NXC8_9CHLO|nr:hypothetical protein Rsub_03356 [Raphidocelis subcapitata]|eukprot:GBF90223.1 hypothetical protein Rsub_03356 [Raphidocelis subcapitata]